MKKVKESVYFTAASQLKTLSNIFHCLNAAEKKTVWFIRQQSLNLKVQLLCVLDLNIGEKKNFSVNTISVALYTKFYISFR